MFSRTSPDNGTKMLVISTKRYWPRKRRDNLFRGVVIATTLTFLYVAAANSGIFADQGESVNSVFHRNRKLLQDGEEEAAGSTATQGQTRNNSSKKECTDERFSPDGLFPSDVFSCVQLSHGAVVLHILGIIYMFYALALVCDEFFVPSLDVITEKLEISPDVAGATFMAAGGSAPELFTSVIGVFIAQNDVGIGTIVGSAVFNILFVIAACAFAAKEALSLTAWPLIRDVFFYSVSLILLVIFFNHELIEWWEALILFLWYFAYVGFMKFNEPVEDKLREILKLSPAERDSDARGVVLRRAENRKGLFHLMNETINPGILRKRGLNDNNGEEMYPLNTKKEFMIGESSSGIGQLKTQLGPGSTATDVSTAGNGAPNTKEMEDIEAGGDKAKERSNNDGVKPQTATHQFDNNERETWASSASMSNAAPANTEEGNKQPEADGEEPIDMSFPKNGGCMQILVYLISFPIMAPLFVTLPDTKNPSKKKFFPITFIGSILWIAVFSYLMVWWATIAGEIIGIDAPIMGLTFLAAGTSVPDLITSVLVAKQGKGDMAVSSSVGSNIFDVTVGLPFPWLLYSLVNMEPVTVSSEGLGCSVTLLFVMLILVFLSIVAFRWKMTKAMGIVMMLLYVAFVIVTLGFTYGWYPCLI